jgi:hypothetical protein
MGVGVRSVFDAPFLGIDEYGQPVHLPLVGRNCW